MVWTEITRAHYERRCARYASDLTEAEWALIEPMMPSANRIVGLRKTDLREVVNALLYLASSGGGWRLLPKDFPPFRRCRSISDLAPSFVRLRGGPPC